jgi:hypothetical protein
MTDKAEALAKLLIRNFNEVPLQRKQRAPLHDSAGARLARGTAAINLGASIDVVAPGMRNRERSDFSRSTAQQFHELQTQLGNVAGGNVDIDVRVALSSKPAGATETSVWVDVLLTQEQGYITLIRAATLRLDGADLHQSGRT